MKEYTMEQFLEVQKTHSIEPTQTWLIAEGE